jgi:phosphoribosylamine--glycine ligase
MSSKARPDTSTASPEKVLLLGSGGREHALAWCLAREADIEAVIAAPGSDAMDEERKVRCVADVKATDPAAVLDLATAEDVDLVVVGPEAPLAAGVADPLVAAGIPVFGPVQAAARIESSKSFCREVAAAANVRMACGESFAELEPALAFAGELAGAPGSPGVVVKADGLAAGKGVTVCDDLASAEAALRGLFAGLPTGSGGAPVVVLEERLFGLEASLIALCDGRSAIGLPPARDHKRLLDEDRGPNTGGMGAYSPVPDLPESLGATLIETIHLPVLAELARRGSAFRGALYAGLMLTPEGPCLLEFNARFGDPETQALLPRLAVPLGPLLLGAARGSLAQATAALRLRSTMLPTTGDAAVAIVLAASGYPESPRKGDPIEGLGEAAGAGATVFHAGTVRGADGRYRTSGGRVLSVVGLGSSLASARANAERAAEKVTWEGMQRRHDIAARLPAAVPEEAGAMAAPISPADWEAGR